MRTITLQRHEDSGNSTIGRMDVFGTHIFTLEDTHRDTKILGETCIPAGTYGLMLRNEGRKTLKYKERYGDMHEGMIWLVDVPDFSWVYIHTGNHAGHTEGCILVGMGKAEDTVTSSRVAYRKIYPLIIEAIKDGGCELEIRDAGMDQ
jgi:hypothetical protein